MYFMIGTGVLAVTTVGFAREAWKLHKKLETTEKVLNRRMMDVAAVTHQRDENKKKINRTEVALGAVKVSLKKAEEKVVILEGEKKRITEQITTVKNTVQEARTEINSLKIDKEDLEKKLKKAEDYHNKVNAEIKKVKAESEAVSRNMDLILNGSRDVRRDFVKNGMKNIELYR
ncbi:hypothetical protein VSU16_04675 [Cetobacterium somerae]|uniref:hypothetical protein n=1 Tax=Cetobacterium somerae TaxID=188913 RepID=UPI002E7B343F|nr:hypothetical protein [Cetobacterium somerae]WVJ02038.1 hypothetical protein VSU16_04675 [Cetobacterium somerae]